MPLGVHLSSVGERKLSAILYEHCIVALGVCGAIRSSTQQHAAARDPFSIGLGALRFDFFKIVPFDSTVDAAAAAARPWILVDRSLTIFAYL